VTYQNKTMGNITPKDTPDTWGDTKDQLRAEAVLAEAQDRTAQLHAEVVLLLNQLIFLAPTEEARNSYRERLTLFV
jgi:hypothetical protein